MFDLLHIAKALGDANRLRILMALRERDLCVCQVTAFLDLAPSTTSKHLSILRQSRLIESCKQGRWVYYCLADARHAPQGHVSPVVLAALHWVRESLAADPGIVQDESRIKALLKAEADSGLDSAEYCHSPELHLIDQDMESCAIEDLSQEEHSHDKEL